MPVMRSITAATRHRVQRVLAKPKERGPRRSVVSTKANCLAVSLDFRPDPRRRRPLTGAPSLPRHSQYQLWAHWRLTPRQRATADWPSPLAKSCSALLRRSFQARVPLRSCVLAVMAHMIYCRQDFITKNIAHNFEVFLAVNAPSLKSPPSANFCPRSVAWASCFWSANFRPAASAERDRQLPSFGKG